MSQIDKQFIIFQKPKREASHAPNDNLALIRTTITKVYRKFMGYEVDYTLGKRETLFLATLSLSVLMLLGVRVQRNRLFKNIRLFFRLILRSIR